MTALHPRIVSCKVISLEGSERIDGFFQRPGSEHFEVVRATDGRKGEGEELFDREAFRSRYGREPLPGEIGCAVSHYRVLREFAFSPGAMGDLALIAEDDARLSKHAIRTCNRIARRVRHIDIGLLAHTIGRVDKVHVAELVQRRVRLSLTSSILGWSGSTFYRFGFAEGDIYGSGLYVISRGAAMRYVDFVRQSRCIGWVADDYEVICDAVGNGFKFLRPNIASWQGRSTIRTASNPIFEESGGPVLSRLRGNIAIRTRIRQFCESVIVTMRQFGWRSNDG